MSFFVNNFLDSKITKKGSNLFELNSSSSSYRRNI